MANVASFPAAIFSSVLSKARGFATVTATVAVCLFLSVTMTEALPSLTPVTVTVFLSAFAVAVFSSVDFTVRGCAALATVTLAVAPGATVILSALSRSPLLLLLSLSLSQDANTAAPRQHAATIIVLKIVFFSISFLNACFQFCLLVQDVIMIHCLVTH